MSPMNPQQHGMFVPIDQQIGQCGANITVTPNMASTFSACMYNAPAYNPAKYPVDCKDIDVSLQNCKLRLQMPGAFTHALHSDPGYTYDYQHHQLNDRPQHQNITKTQTPSVTRRNERERNRVKLINLTFATLRQHIPALTKNGRTKKMSKVDTLKAAIDYIRHLKHMVTNTDLLADTITNSYIENRTPVSTNNCAPQYSPVSSLHSPSPSSCSESSYEHPLSTDDDVLDLAHWF